MNTLIKALIIFIGFSFVSVDVSDDIAGSMRKGSAKEVAAFFIDNIDMKILDKEDVYSKAQAELILKNFFEKHPVKSFTIAHKSGANAKHASMFTIGILDTEKGKFRTYFLMKKTGDKTQIQQFRIEQENE